MSKAKTEATKTDDTKNDTNSWNAERADIIDANKGLADQNTELLAQKAEQAKELEELRAQIAKSIPVSFTPRHDITDVDMPRDGTAQFEDDKLIVPARGTVDQPENIAKNDLLAFMNEPVEVEIQTTMDNTRAKAFEISVNGAKEVFVVGETKVVKRMFVEGLARAKRSDYENEEYMDDKMRRGYRWPQLNTQRYAFSVTQDNNPRGREWLNGVLRQA